MNKLKRHKTILITIVILIIVISISLFVIQAYNQKNQNKNSDACDSFSVEECPGKCVVCPPCEVCSSISCQSEEFCTGIGFNRSWYEEIVIKLKK